MNLLAIIYEWYLFVKIYSKKKDWKNIIKYYKTANVIVSFYYQYNIVIILSLYTVFIKLWFY